MGPATRPEHPDDEVLAELALGGDSPDEVGTVTAADRAHVDRCERCAAELDELRYTVRVASLATLDAGARPAPGVWAGVAAGLREDDVPAERRVEQPAARPVELAGRHRHRPTVPLRAAAALAAACLVVGGLAGRVLAPDTETVAAPPTPPAPTATPGEPVVQVAAGELDAVDDGHRMGTATVSRTGDQIALMLTLPPVDAEGGYLEVWMLDPDLEQMVSVGVLGDSGSPSFTIPERLLDRGLLVVDVSRQSFTGGPAHSGDSVARGTLST